MRRLAIVALIWAALLISLPVTLSWTRNGTAPEAENRAPAALPTEARPQEAEWFSDLTDVIEDRLALSGQATRLLSRFDLEFGGRIPSSDVLVGEHGLLFLRKSLESPCLDEVDLALERQRLDELVDVAQRRSVQLVLVVVPDKMAVEVGAVPAAFRDRAQCLHDRAIASEALAREVLGGDALPALQLLDTTPSSYFRDDTHWNAEGRRRIMRALVETLQPGMWDPAAVDVVTGEREKDLLVLAGVPETHEVEDNRVRFGTVDDARRWPGLDRAVEVTATPAPGRELVETPTLVVHDSFVASWRQEFVSLFADVRFVHWDDVDEPEAAASLLEGRDTLVVELVGRSYWGDSVRMQQLAELVVRAPAGP